MAKSTAKTYKHTVWSSFSRFIKVRDANSSGLVKCCTCTKVLHYQDPELNAGHFIPGHNNTTLFNEKIVHGQCVDCNLGGQGMQYEYGKFMQEKYGYDQGTLDEMQTWRHKVKKVLLCELKELKDYFDSEYERIKKEKGI